MFLNYHYSIAGGITGFIVGLTGVGGGALMTPILLIFFGVPPAAAVATDLWFAVITKLFAFGVHSRSGNIDWQVVKRLWLGSIPIAIGTVIYVALFHSFGKSLWLSNFIGWVVIITAMSLILSPYFFSASKKLRIEFPDKFKYFQPILTVIAGAMLGLSVALTSIGAGALGSVILLYLYPLRLTPHRLIATDIAHAIPLAAIAGTGYLLSGLVNTEMLTSLLIGSIPAVIIGSKLTDYLPTRFIQIILAVTLISASAKILF